MANERNVVIFGETGVGKSSLINMLFDKEVAETSNLAIGCTFESKFYKGKRNGDIFNIYDTAGLNESDRGNVRPDVAIRNLIDLLISLKDGVHLLVMCIRMGRLNSSAVHNYQLFNEGIFSQRVPILLVVTHCELDEPIDKWKIDNESLLTTQLHMYFKEILCVTTVSKGRYAANFRQEFLESRNAFGEAIVRHSLTNPWVVDICLNALFPFVKNIWNIIADYLHLPKTPLNQVLYQVFRRFCSSDEEALESSNKFAVEINKRFRKK